MPIVSKNFKLNALIVEDNVDDMELVVYQLKKSFDPVRYTHVQNINEFLSALEKSAAASDPSERFDVILSDWSVPGYDSFAALEALQRIDPTVPFIIVSGAIGEPAAVALTKAGAYDFVLKEQSNHLSHVILKAIEWAEQKKTDAAQRFQIELQTKALQSSPIAIAILEVNGSFEWVNRAYETLTGWSLGELKGHFLWEFCTQYDKRDCRKVFDELKTKDLLQREGTATRKDGSRYHEFSQMAKLTNAKNEVQRYLFIRQDITSLRQYRSRLEVDAELPMELANCQTEGCLYETAAAYIKRAFGLNRVGFIRLMEQGEPEGRWFGDDLRMSPAPHSGEGARFTVTLDDKARALCVVDWGDSLIEGTDRLISYALEKIEQPLSKLIIQETAQEWVKRLSLLDILKEYFSAGQNMNKAMLKILKIIKEALRADGIGIFIQESDGTLICKYHEGFFTKLIEETRVPAGQKNVGLAMLEKRIVFENDLGNDASFVPQLRALVDQEKFVTQYCLPVILANEVRGVLELFFRAAFRPDQTWLAFGQAAAYQIGIALQMQSIIEALDKAYRDLESANESIIEGLSSALEFRDQETEGHTVRVTAMFMIFASRFTQDENELKRWRIGSLLHDIGKIGIPDAVLNKPGPLTPEERMEIQKHPLISKEILSRIPSLHDCIDIPLYHHEKFDGTGYPFGLMGEGIPLSARIFAIIDVYEALVSDRPYRKAWPKAKALEYIRENAGTHFDPKIALEFVELNSD